MMRKEVVHELQRRCEILIAQAEPNSIASGMTGSRLRFDMAMCILGSGTKTEKFSDANSEKSEPAMSEEEYFGEVYDEVLTMLLSEAMERVSGK